MMRYLSLSEYPKVFRAMTGLHVSEFDELVTDVMAPHGAAEVARLSRPEGQRVMGAGHRLAWRARDHILLTYRKGRLRCTVVNLAWRARDHILLTVIWLRVYPTQEVLGYLFGVSDSPARSVIQRVRPVLEKAGRDTMRLPDPGRKRRRKLDDLVHDTPELAVVIDSFEQRVHRPGGREQAEAPYSGKKKAPPLKSQVAVDEESGPVVDVADSVPGPIADMTLLKQSTLIGRLPAGVGGLGDQAYVGINHRGAAPRRKPRGQPRPLPDTRSNPAFSKRRMVVEPTIGRLRRFSSPDSN